MFCKHFFERKFFVFKVIQFCGKVVVLFYTSVRVTVVECFYKHFFGLSDRPFVHSGTRLVAVVVVKFGEVFLYTREEFKITCC